ncbi:hypothetical protein FACS1894186_7540 [Alphaproteobacteria bacterium]|nr:hypothetical protein FACS1894186_7540 [Alphaproteobacteria bacterium]
MNKTIASVIAAAAFAANFLAGHAEASPLPCGCVPPIEFARHALEQDLDIVHDCELLPDPVMEKFDASAAVGWQAWTLADPGKSDRGVSPRAFDGSFAPQDAAAPSEEPSGADEKWNFQPSNLSPSNAYMAMIEGLPEDMQFTQTARGQKLAGLFSYSTNYFRTAHNRPVWNGVMPRSLAKLKADKQASAGSLPAPAPAPAPSPSPSPSPDNGNGSSGGGGGGGGCSASKSEAGYGVMMLAIAAFVATKIRRG